MFDYQFLINKISIINNKDLSNQTTSKSIYYQKYYKFIIDDLYARIDLFFSINKNINLQDYDFIIIDKNPKYHKEYIENFIKNKDLNKKLNNKYRYISNINDIFNFNYQQSLSAPANSSKTIIIAPMLLHLIDDYQKFFYNISLLSSHNSNCNNKNIIIFGNLLGEQSFANIKNIFYKIEEKLHLPHYQRFIPFLKNDQIAQILSANGYKDIITDNEYIEIEFDSIIKLIKEIKYTGITNILSNRTLYSINKEFYKELNNYLTMREKFKEKVNFVSFVASN